MSASEDAVPRASALRMFNVREIRHGFALTVWSSEEVSSSRRGVIGCAGVPKDSSQQAYFFSARSTSHLSHVNSGSRSSRAGSRGQAGGLNSRCRKRHLAPHLSCAVWAARTRVPKDSSERAPKDHVPVLVQSVCRSEVSGALAGHAVLC